MKNIAFILALFLSITSSVGEIQAQEVQSGTQAAKTESRQSISRPSTVQTIVLNDITVLSLVDSPHTFQASEFPNIENYPSHKALMPSGTFEVPVKTYLVRTAGKNVLVDGGKGKEAGVDGATPDILKANGIQPADITDIVLTHMDIDHVGGLVHNGKAVFPRAILRVSRAEYDAWMAGTVGRPADQVAVGQRVAAAYKNRLQPFDFGSMVLPGITAIDASGHTPGHTVFDITSGDKGLTIVGDLLHISPLQLRHTDYAPIFDAAPSQAAASRENTLARLSKGNRLIAGMHFPMMGKVRPAPNGGYFIIPENE